MATYLASCKALPLSRPCRCISNIVPVVPALKKRVAKICKYLKNCTSPDKRCANSSKTSFKEPVSSSKTVNQDTFPPRKAFLVKNYKMLSFYHVEVLSTLCAWLWFVFHLHGVICTSTVVMTGMMNLGIFVEELFVWRFHHDMSKVKYLSLQLPSKIFPNIWIFENT